MKLVQCNPYLISTIGTDGLILKHQDIIGNGVDDATMCFQQLVG